MREGISAKKGSDLVMRTKRHPWRACLTAAMMSGLSTLLFAINSGRFSSYAVLTVSIIINCI